MMRFSRCVASAALLSLVAAAASAQRLYEFEEERAAVGVVASRSLSGPTDGEFTPAQALPVRLDLDLLASAPDTLAFPMPEGDETLWAVRSRFEERERGGFEWHGYIPGSLVDSVLLVGDSRGLFGTFGTEIGQRYEISGSRDAARIRPIIYGAPLDHSHEHPTPRPSPGQAAPPRQIQSPDAAAATVASASTTTYTIDVLVLYTEEAEAFWKSDYGSRSTDYLVNYAAVFANQAFENSNTPARLRVVHHQRMPKSADPGWGFEWEDATTTLTKTENEDVAKLRRKHDADMVVSFVYGSDRKIHCGLAWGRTRGWGSSGWWAANAFMYVNVYCDEPIGWHYDANNGNYWKPFDYPYWEAVPHEIGHLLGAHHDRDANPPPDPAWIITPYAYGHVDTTNNVRTVMASGSQTKINYFSSATPHPAGYTLGAAGQSENDRVIRMTAEETSTFSKYIVKPAKPSHLTGQASVIHGSVLLRWRDNADNETRYVVKYRRAGKQWKNAPEDEYFSAVPNIEKANIHALEPGKLYTFRVNAVNAGGSSSSNKIRLRTGGPQ